MGTHDWCAGDEHTYRKRMSERTRWRIIWVIFAAYFTAAETVAIRSGHPDAPLSAHLRWAFGVHRRSRLGKLAFGGFALWLFRHLW